MTETADEEVFGFKPSDEIDPILRRRIAGIEDRPIALTTSMFVDLYMSVDRLAEGMAGLVNITYHLNAQDVDAANVELKKVRNNVLAASTELQRLLKETSKQLDLDEAWKKNG